MAGSRPARTDASPARAPLVDLTGRVLHRDGLMLVIDKPAGLPVHRGPKGGPTVEDGLDALRFGLPAAPVLAHRLDRDTSGCLLLGRHRKATARLGRLFAENRIAKTYLALLTGELPADEGLIDAPIGQRSPDPRSWWMKVDPEGQPATTRWRVLGRAEGRTLVQLEPETGRTHQLRVHTAHLGCPIVGDPIYGECVADGPSLPLHLHAWRVRVPLSDRKPPVEVTAEPPPYLAAQLRIAPGGTTTE